MEYVVMPIRGRVKTMSQMWSVYPGRVAKCIWLGGGRKGLDNRTGPPEREAGVGYQNNGRPSSFYSV